ncbi:hypothetical protein [Streptomyces sp. ISL-94]|uniref:hypothetical protein n=1 Tax=Streptomyces sp. ISL-94 TaxID=2819190 RepID=UPI001BEA4425|nr:hypothetical protein [Streptomyces sp. ISL-94]MBT2478851.1 hypothetical protein [Streptomyces sp. ISL-94]
MHPPPLTPRERQSLDAIEQALGRDRLMERRLRTLQTGTGPDPHFWRSVRASSARLLLAACVTACLVLLTLAVATDSGAWITAFAVTWPATLLVTAALLSRWCRRYR